VANERTTTTRTEERRGSAMGTQAPGHQGIGEATTLASTAGMIGLAALVVGPEVLIPVAAGAGLVYASRFIAPIMGGILAPAVKTMIKAGYSVAASAGEMVSEVSETVQDAVAEAKAEHRGTHPS